jgi:hypothetical protein
MMVSVSTSGGAMPINRRNRETSRAGRKGELAGSFTEAITLAAVARRATKSKSIASTASISARAAAKSTETAAAEVGASTRADGACGGVSSVTAKDTNHDLRFSEGRWLRAPHIVC